MECVEIKLNFLQNFTIILTEFVYYLLGDNMIQVELFDEENEEDLMDEINNFLEELEDESLIDIKFSTSHFITQAGNQVYSFAAMVMYKVVIK